MEVKQGGPSSSPIDRSDRRATSFHLACQNILAHSPQGIMVIRVEIDSRLLIRLNQSASTLPTVGRMTWRLSSRNCTYGEPSPPRVPHPSHTHARARTRSPWTCFTDRQIIKHMHCPLARPVGIAAHQPCITAAWHYGHTRRIVRIACTAPHAPKNDAPNSRRTPIPSIYDHEEGFRSFCFLQIFRQIFPNISSLT